jgi:hypothetical protein
MVPVSLGMSSSTALSTGLLVSQGITENRHTKARMIYDNNIYYTKGTSYHRKG